MNKSEASEIFEKIISNPCPVCKVLPGELCDTTALWVHLERIHLSNKKDDFSTYWQHMVDCHEETHDTLYKLVNEAKNDHPDFTPEDLLDLVHNRQHTSLDWEADHNEANLSFRPKTDLKIPKIKDFALTSRLGASEVVEKLNDLLIRYQVATLADLYDLVGLPHDFNDERWGWVNLNRTRIDRVKEGYVLRLPPVEYVKDIRI